MTSLRRQPVNSGCLLHAFEGTRGACPPPSVRPSKPTPRSSPLPSLMRFGAPASTNSRASRAVLPPLPPLALPAAPRRPKATKKAGRLGRRSPDDSAQTLDSIGALVAKHADGLRAEQIKAALNLDKREMPKPIAEGLKSGVLKKSGNKRATVYTAGKKKK